MWMSVTVDAINPGGSKYTQCLPSLHGSKHHLECGLEPETLNVGYLDPLRIGVSKNQRRCNIDPKQRGSYSEGDPEKDPRLVETAKSKRVKI